MFLTRFRRNGQKFGKDKRFNLVTLDWEALGRAVRGSCIDRSGTQGRGWTLPGFHIHREQKHRHGVGTLEEEMDPGTDASTVKGSCESSPEMH
jgi:hypothetical protein